MRRKLISAGCAALACSLSLGARAASGCSADRTVSTLVGAGIGAAAAAIPATIVHRHDQSTSHRIVAISITAGAIVGFLAANRDRPCATRSDSSSAGNTILASRSEHSQRGALVGVAIGAVLAAVGSRLYPVGCDLDRPCNSNGTRLGLTLFSAGEGAIAGGLLGSLIGWAWPIYR